jgi:amino acid transporter
MNRKKLKQSLGLVNVGVLFGLLVFYPRCLYGGISYGSEFERLAKELINVRDWLGIWAILILSTLVALSIYFLLLLVSMKTIDRFQTVMTCSNMKMTTK